jgi:hypothetical protein
MPSNERARRLTALEGALTEQLISLLFELGAIIRHRTSTTAYYLHMPGAGALCKQLNAHRAEAVARLERARWKECLEEELIGSFVRSLPVLGARSSHQTCQGRGGARILRSVRVDLPLDALGADLIGKGLATRIRTTGGLYYRKPR